VTGGVTPAKLKPDPLEVIWEIVRAEPPIFVSVSPSVLLLPVATLPKLRLTGLAASCPAVTPVPDSGTLSVGFAAFEVIARFPLTLPLDTGEKTRLKFALWPPANVSGSVTPDALNPVPVAPIAEIVTLAPPEFVKIAVAVCELPI
jgi:hypothetical protein